MSSALAVFSVHRYECEYIYWAMAIKCLDQMEGETQRLNFNFMKFTQTFACSLSPSVTNSDIPFPARATPLTNAVEAPEPIPTAKHLNCRNNKSLR